MNMPCFLLVMAFVVCSAVIPAFDEMIWTKQAIWKLAKQPNALLYTNPIDEDSKLRALFPHAKEATASSIDGPNERRDPSLKPLELNDALEGAALGTVQEQHVRPASIAAQCPMCHLLVAQIWHNVTLEMMEKLKTHGFSGMRSALPKKTHLRSLLLDSCTKALSPSPEEGDLSSVEAMLESQSIQRIQDPTGTLLFFIVQKRGAESPKATEHERKAVEIACKNVAQLASSTLSQLMSDSFAATPSLLEETLKALGFMKEVTIDRSSALALVQLMQDVVEEVQEEYLDLDEHLSKVEEDDDEEEDFEDLNCMDLHILCRKWADHGECKANPNYMVGTATQLGHCRKSCGVCVPQKRPKPKPEPKEGGSTEADMEELVKAHPTLKEELSKLFKTIHSSVRTEACMAAKVCIQSGAEGLVTGAPAQLAAAQGQWKLGAQFYGLAEVKALPSSSTPSPSPSNGEGAGQVLGEGPVEEETLGQQVSKALKKDLGGRQLSISADFFDYFFVYKTNASQSGSHPTTIAEQYSLGTFQRESVEVLDASTGLPATLHTLDLLPNLASLLSQMEWPYVKQVYTGGDECVLGGGRRVLRKVEARIACSPDQRIHMLVREPDFCSYVYVVYSPSLCEVTRFKPKFRGIDVEISVEEQQVGAHLSEDIEWEGKLMHGQADDEDEYE